MIIAGIIIYALNAILGLFALNIVVKHKKKVFIIVGANYIFVSILGLFIFSPIYLFEGLILLLLFGIPFVLTNKTLPRFITNDENNLLKLAFIPALCLWIIIFL